MSLPQTEWAAPPGEHARLNVCPSAPFSDVALACQVVGVPSLVENGEDGPVFELSGEALMWPPPLVPAALFSFRGFEQPALPSISPARMSTT